MLRFRHILHLVLCFSVCLIVCVLPVSAADDTYYTGTLTGSDPDDGWYVSKSGSFGNATYYYLLSDANGSITFDGVDTFTTANSGNWTKAGHPARSFLKVEIPYSGYLDLEHAEFYPYVEIDGEPAVIGSNMITCWIDGVEVLFNAPVNDFSFSGQVTNRFAIRIDGAATAESRTLGGAAANAGIILKLPGLIKEPASVNDILDEIKIVSGTLEEINGNVVEIVESVTHIDSIVTDTHEQLQDPDSNIWQAAGSVISDSIESLFVPSEQDIADVKQGFDDLAQDKLGGAYTAMETVDDTLTQVNDKLNNPSAASGVPFPGISVPLGGDVGTVTLVSDQMVTLPVEFTSVLHPIAFTIVSVVCGLGTFNVLKDMVECFLSGYSYSAFLHRHKGGSDE